MLTGSIENLTIEEYIIMITIASILIMFFIHLPINILSKAKGLYNNFWD